MTSQSGSLRVISAIFFTSGIPALIYQLVWQRSLFTIYGINIESVTVVVTAFMLGLGIGSFVGGRLTRLKLPLLGLFAGIEFCIGAFGLVSLALFHAVGEFTLGLGTLATGLVTFALVLLPTVLMGATLPLLTAHLVRHSGNVGQSVGWLYFVNTLGSAFACFLVAFVVMRALGQQGAVTLAASLNLLVGAGAWLAQRGTPSLPPPATALEGSFRRRGFLFALLLSALCGYIALSYEILWYRLYSFSTGGSAHAFALLLGCYLLGIALGSAASRRFCRTQGPQQLLALSAFTLAANVASFLLVPAAGQLAGLAHWGFSYPLVILAAGLLGATFPLICHYAIAPDARAGEGLSYLYLANIVGSGAGSLVTGFVLMDHWSMGAISLFLALLGLLLSAALLLPAKLPMPRLARRLALALGAGVVLAALTGPLFEGIYERLYYKSRYEGQRFAHLVESKSGVVSVTHDGEIHGGGIYDGRFSVDLVNDSNMIVRAYALSLFHAAPREVLIIGLSSGSWAQVVANHPQVEKVTIVEISPSYLEVIPRFPEEAGLLKNPKVEIIIDDGRRWLRRNEDRRFDFILQNTSFNWRAHTTNLLSREYHMLVKGHLKPGGVFFFNTTWSGEAQRTAALSFAHAARFINFMAVSDEPLSIDAARWREVLAGYRIEGRRVFELSRERHRARLNEILSIVETLRQGPPPGPGFSMESRESLLARTEGLREITDDNMGTEWYFNP